MRRGTVLGVTLGARLLIVMALVLSQVGCSSPLRVEPGRSAVEHPEFVRVVARDAVPGELKLLVLNLGEAPLTVFYDQISIAAHFGKLHRPKKTGRTYTVAAHASRLLTLRFSADGLRSGDSLTVSFDGAIVRSGRPARLNPLDYMVKN